MYESFMLRPQSCSGFFKGYTVFRLVCLVRYLFSAVSGKFSLHRFN